jgi:hypothetical protein
VARSRFDSLERAVFAPLFDEGRALDHSPRREPSDFYHGQARIAPAARAPHGQCELHRIACPQGDWSHQTLAVPRLLRRASPQGAVWATCVVPMPVVVQSPLDAGGRQAGKHAPPPDAERAKHPLDLAVEKGRAHAPAYEGDPAGRQVLAKPLAELRGDPKVWLSSWRWDQTRL